MNFNREKDNIPRILQNAFKQIIEPCLECKNFNIYNKGFNDLVTDCDIQVEQFIIAEIMKIFKSIN